MTKSEIVRTIKLVAHQYGFEVKENDWHCLGVSINAENVNFFIKETPTLTMSEKKVTHTFEFSASVSRMGGETTAEELHKIANEIHNAALVVEFLNLSNMSFDEYLED